jgi:hypothetical protein
LPSRSAWSRIAIVLAIQLVSMIKCREFLAQPAKETTAQRARLTFIVLDLLFGLV